MKVLVTGGTGFIGSNLVHRLVERGDEVRVLQRTGADKSILDGLPVEVMDGDVTDTDSVRVAADGVEGVYHVAGMVSYWRPRRRTQYKVNVDGTRNVVAAAARAGVRRLVHTSSIAAVGFRTDGGLSDEDTEWNWGPLNVGYCITKRMAEEEAFRGGELGLEVIALNPGLVFGPRDVNWNAGRIFKMVATKKVVRGVDGCTTTCDVEDVCEAHVGAMERGRPGQRYVLGGEPRSYADLIQDVAGVMGREVRVQVIPYWAAQAAARGVSAASLVTRREPPITPELLRMTCQTRVYSSERAIRELGYPQTPLRQALEKAYRWYRSAGRL